MRHLALFLSLIIAFSANAGVLQSAKIDASVNNIGPNYTVSVSPLNISVPNAFQAGTVCWSNQTGAALAIFVDNDKSTTAPANDVQDVYIPANTPGINCLPPPLTKITRSLQIRSASGSTVSSGLFYLFITDRRG